MFLIRPQRALPPTQQLRAGTSGLAARLEHAWGLGPFGNGVLDLAGRGNGTFGVGSGGTTGNAWRLSPSGLYLNFDDSGTSSTASPIIPVGDSAGSGGPSSNVVSVQARIRLGSVGTVQGIYAGNVTTSLQFRVETGGQISLIHRGNALIGQSSGTLSSGVDVDVGFSYDGANVTFFIAGQASGTATSARSFASSQYYLGASDSAGNTERISNGSRIYYLYVWGRTRAANEFAAIAANPWQVFPPVPRRIWAAAAASGFSATITEPASGADASTATPTLAAAATEATTAADSSTVTATKAQAITEPASAADSSTAVLARFSAITEPASAADSSSQTATKASAVTEAITAADSSAVTAAPTAAITEAASAADSSTASAAGNFSATITEAASATDASTQAPTLAAAITEPATAADAATATGAFTAAITEAAGAADSSTASAAGNFSAVITEAAAAADAATGLRAALAAILEPANPIDVSRATLNAVGPAVAPAARGVGSNLATAARLANLAGGGRPSNLSTGRRGPNRARS